VTAAPREPPEASRQLEALTVFVMARLRGERAVSMCGALRADPHGWDAVYTLNGELYLTQFYPSEARARQDLAAHQDALAAAGWTPAPFHP
jgi:hypothetical protein